ncbi:hypothetical protein ACFQ2T_10885 [Methylophilus flavus]|uniref:Lipoprotein n=1 Tax=Methylophilus flavus TaxID=640084 RepID=A0ABW3PEP1_9PROT
MLKNHFLGLALFIFLTLASSGCSRQAWYEGVKEGARNNCRSQPPGEVEPCLIKLNTKTHEEYEKERSGTK